MSIRTHLCTIACMLLCGCIDRPIGLTEPRTTSMLTTRFDQAAPTKLDLLLVVDNSASMADKQDVLADTLPDLVKTLVTAPCVRADGTRQVRDSANEPCEAGAEPEFEPLSDIQVGVITSSLGGFGAPNECKDGEESDMAHLLATRPRAQHIPTDEGVLKWRRGEDPKPFMDHFSALVREAGQLGCGWESGLEAWYRFLIDPEPYVALSREPCDESDRDNLCTRAISGPDGKRLIDEALLAQRKAFLRPDSLLVVAMLSDENDCSFQEHPRSWLLSQTINSNNSQQLLKAYRGSSTCAANPNDPCCHSCAIAPAPECPSELNEEGTTVGEGCAENKGRYGDEITADPPNLRCFDQKRRFGIDLLYPEQRYINALTAPKLCPSSPSLAASECEPAAQIDNPLFTSGADGSAGRPVSDVFLVGLLGVPWQDLAQDPNPSVPLRYRPTESADGVPGVNWDWLLGSEEGPPQDALMIESIIPRMGTTPAIGEPLAPSEAAALANPINGHEWTNPRGDDLQYACIFPLVPKRKCLSAAEEQALVTQNQAVPSCDCTPAPEQNVVESPLCQVADGSYGLTQYYAKAYPATRQLRVLRGVGAASVVASICPKELTDRAVADFGYRPAMQAIVDRLEGRLQALCLDRGLAVNEDHTAQCRIVEVRRADGSCSCGQARQPVDETLRRAVNQQLINQTWCQDEANCNQHCACVIEQVPGDPSGFASCQLEEDASGDGWCYIDAEQQTGAPELVATCPPTSRRKVRFVGAGIPAESSTTILSCAGSILDDGESKPNP